MSGLNILVLHRIVKNKTSEWADVRLALFIQLLEAAKRNNQEVVSIGDWAKGDSGELALSFDDGYSSDFEIVLPLLKEYGFQGTFFITPNYVGKKGYMSWDQIKDLGKAGMEIGSHSLSHPYMSTLSTEHLLIELKDSKAQIERYIDKEVVSFAYPFGDCSGKTHQAAIEAGYKNICTSKPGLCKSRAGILSRNSIHSNVAENEFEQLLSPINSMIFRKKTGYFVRYGLKRFFGTSNYIKFRDFFY